MPTNNRRSGHNFCVLILVLTLGSGLWGQAPGPGPESVVVVANSAFEGSLKVARAYVQRRGIPEENLIILETAVEERISREAFTETIFNPILEALRERKLVDAFEGSVDAYGRNSLTLFSSKARYMVLCYGVPFQVGQSEVPEEVDQSYRQRHFKGSLASFVQSLAEGNMSGNHASVDGELALMLRRETPLKGFYPNPLHKNRLPDTVRDILRVTRLDGPSPEAVIRMLDNSLVGEREGLKGQAYVDEDGRGGTYQMGNTWMAGAAQAFDALGYGLVHNTAGHVIRADERFDAPVLYAGWYAGNVTGPFTLPGFRFPPGAVAAHLHSFSATHMRDPNKGWVGPFVERGVSATFGNVAEPYLTLTHHFDLFFTALANGWNFADAAYFALPGLSWQAVSVGDPLYRPFAVGIEEQLKNTGHPAHVLEDQYVVGRQINLLIKSGQQEEAMRLAARGMRETPGPALALQRARLLFEQGDKGQAIRTLSIATQMPPSDWSDWGLFAEIADTLRSYGRPQMSLDIYKSLERQKMPEQVQLAFLKRGIQSARDAGESGLAIEWQARVTPPPPPAEEKRESSSESKTQ